MRNEATRVAEGVEGGVNARGNDGKSMGRLEVVWRSVLLVCLLVGSLPTTNPSQPQTLELLTNEADGIRNILAAAVDEPTEESMAFERALRVEGEGRLRQVTRPQHRNALFVAVPVERLGLVLNGPVLVDRQSFDLVIGVRVDFDTRLLLQVWWDG